MHWSWRVYIGCVTFASSILRKHKTRPMIFAKAAMSRKYHFIPSCINRDVRTSVGRHQCRPTEGRSRQALYVSRKLHQAMLINIIKETLLVEYCINCFMCISLSWCQVSTSRIGHGICTSLNSHQFGLPTSPLDYTQRPADVESKVPTSVISWVLFNRHSP